MRVSTVTEFKPTRNVPEGRSRAVRPQPEDAQNSPRPAGKPATSKVRDPEDAPWAVRLRVVLLLVAVLGLAVLLLADQRGSGARRSDGRHFPDTDRAGPLAAYLPEEEVWEEECPDVTRDLVERIQRKDFSSFQDVATGRSLQRFLEEALLVQKVDVSTLEPYGKSSRFTLLRKADSLSPSAKAGEFLLMEFVWTGTEWKLEHIEVRRGV